MKKGVDVSFARVAVMPGTFDPVTHGHLDIIERGASLYERVVVGVSINPGKAPLLPHDERVRLLARLVRHRPNVEVLPFTGMTIDFVRRAGGDVILRGLRTFADFEYEFQLALANRQMGGVETVFIVTSAERTFVRSTLIKEAIALGADVSPFVPPEAAESIRRHLGMTATVTPPSGGAGLGGHDAPDLGRRGSGLRGEGVE